MKGINAEHLKDENLNRDGSRVYLFVKHLDNWYMNPSSPTDLTNSTELENIPAANEILSIIAQGRNTVVLKLSTSWFDKADELVMVELCSAPKGGAYYILKSLYGRPFNRKVWIRDFVLLVFGDMPEAIYFKQLSIHELLQSNNEQNMVSAN
jgi:hypothetical protein